jgi:hypothetical protein
MIGMWVIVPRCRLPFGELLRFKSLRTLQLGPYADRYPMSQSRLSL